MSDNAEEGIAKAQARGGLSSTEQQALRDSNFSDRILTFLVTLGFFGLVVVWMTATSDLLVYGSFVGAMALFIVFGLLKMKRIERIRQERQRQASEWNSRN